MPDEKSGQQSAATLEEAMAMQDKLGREANGEVADEGAATKAEVEEETNAAIEEAGKAQEARDDEVYGREPGAEDRRPSATPAEVPVEDEPKAKQAYTDKPANTSAKSK